MRVLLAIFIGGVLLSGCASPEAGRTRGGGAGADVGNRSAVVKMHEGSDPFWKTPDRIAVEHPTLDSARQSQQLSRPR
jgi:hypothetical protein